MRIAVVVGWLVASVVVPASAREWSVSAGRFDLKDSPHREESLELGAELRLDQVELAHWSWGAIAPVFGVLGNSDGASYGYGGFRLGLSFGSRFRLGIQSTAGIYDEGDSFDLGGPIEFRSGLDVGFRLKSDVTLGVGFHHLSNAGLYDRNPGLNSLLLAISFSPGRGR